MKTAKIKTTIRDQVYSILRERICSGYYEQGSWLMEQEICEDLGVSRSPVREAIRQLSSDGLIVSVPNKGSHIRSFTAKDIDEIFEVRVMLEDYGIEASARTMTEKERQRLLKLSEDFRRTFQINNMTEYIAADEELHDTLVEFGRSNLINEIYAHVRSLNQQFRVSSLNINTRFEDSVTEHCSLIDKLLCGNIKEAKNINHTHLLLAAKTIKNTLK